MRKGKESDLSQQMIVQQNLTGINDILNENKRLRERVRNME